MNTRAKEGNDLPDLEMFDAARIFVVATKNLRSHGSQVACCPLSSQNVLNLTKNVTVGGLICNGEYQYSNRNLSVMPCHIV